MDLLSDASGNTILLDVGYRPGNDPGIDSWIRLAGPFSGIHESLAAMFEPLSLPGPMSLMPKCQMFKICFFLLLRHEIPDNIVSSFLPETCAKLLWSFGWCLLKPFPGTSCTYLAHLYLILWHLIWLKSWVVEDGWRWQIFWLRLEVSFGCLRGDGGHLPNFRPRGWRFSALHHAAALEGGQVPQSTWVFQGKILGKTFPPQLDVKKKGLSHIFFCRFLSPRSWACLRIAWRHRGIWSWCTGQSFFKLSHRSWWWTTAWYHPQLGSQAELSHASHASHASHKLRLVGFFMWAVWASSLATCQNAFIS